MPKPKHTKSTTKPAQTKTETDKAVTTIETTAATSGENHEPGEATPSTPVAEIPSENPDDSLPPQAETITPPVEPVTKPADTEHSYVTVSLQSDTTGTEPTSPTGKKPAPYKITKKDGLTNQQKAGLARHVMIRVGDLMDFQDTQLADESLVGINRQFMADQLAAWVSYLPGKYWDARLPQPSRARGRRKI